MRQTQRAIQQSTGDFHLARRDQFPAFTAWARADLLIHDSPGRPEGRPNY